MAQVVFMRAVNIGGHQTFQPSRLARELAEFDVISIGAAGTFVARNKVTESKLRKAILSKLPFAPELMICPSEEVLTLNDIRAFKDPGAGIQRFVTVMGKPPSTVPRLPISAPEKANWEVRVVAVEGRFALSFRRAGGKPQFYPNEIVEKQLGVPGTTRNWTTIAKIYDILISHK
jgi:uncharacterized protein (DUF1697 family)